MKWKIAKHEPPEDRRNNDGSPMQLLIETLHESGNITRSVMTANQLADYVKSNYRKKIQWLDESQEQQSGEQDDREAICSHCGDQFKLPTICPICDIQLTLPTSEY